MKGFPNHVFTLHLPTSPFPTGNKRANGCGATNRSKKSLFAARAVILDLSIQAFRRILPPQSFASLATLITQTFLTKITRYEYNIIIVI